MQLTETVIPAGVEKPFNLFHLTDSHLCLADDRDDDAKRILAKNRARLFDRQTAGQTTSLFLEQIGFAKKKGFPVLSTGDLIDFVSENNLDFLKETFDGVDLLFAPGNHEFSLYVGEAKEDEAYKQKSFDRVQAVFPQYLTQNTTCINGVTLIGFNNSYYLFTDAQLAYLKEKAATGLPMVVFFHNPLYTAELYRVMMSDLKKPCAYLVGCPEEQLRTYPTERYEQQKPDLSTLRFIDTLYRLPNLKAVIAGHLHFTCDTPLPNGVTQYVTGAGYDGISRILRFE